MHARLVQVLGAILSRVETDGRPNHINAVQCVLFEAMDLVIHLDTAPELMIQSANLLGKFVHSRITNTRYLGLAKMAHLAAANHDAVELIDRPGWLAGGSVDLLGDVFGLLRCVHPV